MQLHDKVISHHSFFTKQVFTGIQEMEGLNFSGVNDGHDMTTSRGFVCFFIQIQAGQLISTFFPLINFADVESYLVLSCWQWHYTNCH